MLNRRDILLLSSLYVAQGLPFGLLSQTLPVVLRERGVSLELVGLSWLVALPWALKFIWAPWVDRFGSARWGRRRSWIIPLQLVSAGALVLLAFVGASSLAALLAVAALLNLVAATQDIATDGLAVERIPAASRGIGNGVQVAGFRIGMVLGGGLLLLALDWIGWTRSLLWLSGLVLVATLPILAHREAPSRPSRRSSTPAFSLAALLIVASFKFGDALAQGMLRPLLVDFGYSLSEIGAIVGLGGFTAGLLGAGVGGFALRSVSRSSGLLLFGVMQSLAVGGYAALAAVGPEAPTWWVWLCCGFEHFAGGLATVALFTVMMDRCRVGSEGTDYTKQACAVVIGSGMATALSGVVASNVGYAAHFTVAMGLSLLGAVAAWEHARCR